MRAHNSKSLRVVCRMNNTTFLLSQISASSQKSLAGVFPLSDAGFNSAGVDATKPSCNVSVPYTHIFYLFLLILCFTPLSSQSSSSFFLPFFYFRFSVCLSLSLSLSLSLLLFNQPNPPHW